LSQAPEPAGFAARFAAWRKGLGWQGVQRSLGAAGVLAVLVMVTLWFVDLRTEQDAAETFVGPPRSDYTLEDFSLTVLGDDGSLSFRGGAPRMTRHPALGFFDVESPDFELHTRADEVWRAEATRARISAEADELKLMDGARIERQAAADVAPISLTSEVLVARPKEDRVETSEPLEVVTPGTILRGVGLTADLAAERFFIHSKVEARYEPSSR
jgi:lipopolysaccharide export system protein LptC